MRWSKGTDPLRCGAGCMALDAAGEDLLKKYWVQWLDDVTNQIGVYSSGGEPYLQDDGRSRAPAGAYGAPARRDRKKLCLDWDRETGNLLTMVVDVPGLRFIPAVGKSEFVARCACGNEKIMARGVNAWTDVIVPGFDLEYGVTCDFTAEEPVVDFVRCPACRGGVS